MKYYVVREGKRGRAEDRGELSIMIAVTVVKKGETCCVVTGVPQLSIYNASKSELNHFFHDFNRHINMF
jgi:hypothetical protein